MATVANRKMLVHTYKNDVWHTEEFATTSDAMRTLRSRGYHFTDTNVFFQEDNYGVIIADGVLIEVEESVDDGIVIFHDEEYLILKAWTEREQAPPSAVRKAIYDRKIPSIKIGKLGLIYVLSSAKWNGRLINGKYLVNNTHYLLSSKWAKKNHISESTVKRAIANKKIPYIWFGKRILIEESLKWIEVQSLETKAENM